MSNEFLDEDLPQSNQQSSVPRMPTGSTPSAMNQSIQQLTPELLDQIINNSAEHPEVRANAKATKDRLFGEAQKELAVPKIVPKPIKDDKGLQPSENPPPIPKIKPSKKSTKKKTTVKKTPKIEKKPVPKIKKPITPPILESINASDESVMDFIGGMQKSLYTEEVELLTEPTKIQLKSMSVEEYKFMTKQLEMFKGDMDKLEESGAEARLKEHRELVLTNALDTLLQRCIVNDYSVEELTMFDWLYLLLVLRCVSRPSDSTFIVTEGSGKKKVERRVSLDIMELLEKLKEDSEKFVKNPLGYIELENDNGLYLMIPTRGDMGFIEKEMMKDSESSLSILTIACSVKAFVSNGKAHIMSPEQRIQLFNKLEYEVVGEIRKAYNESYQNFFSVINEYMVGVFGDIEAIEMSDFILYFYDF